MNEVPEGQHVRLSSNVYIHGAHSTHTYNPTTTNQHTQAHVPTSFLPVQFPACVTYGESLCLSFRPSVPICNMETGDSASLPHSHLGRVCGHGRGGGDNFTSLCLAQRRPTVPCGDFVCHWLLSTAGMEVQRPPVAVSHREASH